MPEYRRILLDGVVRAGAPRGRGPGGRGRPPGGRGRTPCTCRPWCPAKIVAVHLNHRSRVTEFGATLPPAPTYFHKPTSALVGHGGAVVRPEGCQYLNYEGEVAIVIGRTCRGVPPSQAGDYIAGYTIANDFGLHDFRDTDAGSMLRVKGSDTMAPLGPGLVTGWDFHGKRLRTYVNGRARAGRVHRRDAVGHALPGRRHRPHDHPLPRRRAAVGNAGELPAGAARRRGRGRGGRPRHGWPTTSSPGRWGSPAEFGAQPTASEEVISTALGGDWEFRGIRPPIRA